jgi:hypothetical protein
MRQGIVNKYTIGFLTMITSFKPNKINLKSVPLCPFDVDWYRDAPVDPLYMVNPFHDFIADLMKTDLNGYYSLYRSHFDFYTNLWGKHTFEFQGRSLYKTWVIELTQNEHLVVLCAEGKSTSYEYSGIGQPSDEAAQRAISILHTLKEEFGKKPSSEIENGM